MDGPGPLDLLMLCTLQAMWMVAKMQLLCFMGVHPSGLAIKHKAPDRGVQNYNSFLCLIFVAVCQIEPWWRMM